MLHCCCQFVWNKYVQTCFHEIEKTFSKQTPLQIPDSEQYLNFDQIVFVYIFEKYGENRSVFGFVFFGLYVVWNTDFFDLQTSYVITGHGMKIALFFFNYFQVLETAMNTSETGHDTKINFQNFSLMMMITFNHDQNFIKTS